jgi:hypothetical protein
MLKLIWVEEKEMDAGKNVFSHRKSTLTPGKIFPVSGKII